MPIRGLTDAQRLPRLGKIRAGIMVENGGRSYPRATDYFVVPPVVAAIYGEKPSVLDPVIIPLEDEDVFASTYNRLYSRTWGLICKGDGNTALRTVDADVLESTGETEPVGRNSKRSKNVEVPCPCPLLETGRDCRPMMMLQFMLPHVPGIGIWQIDTSSINSIRNVLGSVLAIRAVSGQIRGIPLKLSLVPKEVTPEGMSKKTIHVLELTVSGDLNYFGLRALASEVDATGIAALPEPDDERPEELTAFVDGEAEPVAQDSKPVERAQVVADNAWFKAFWPGAYEIVGAAGREGSARVHLSLNCESIKQWRQDHPSASPNDALSELAQRYAGSTGEAANE